MIIGWIQVIVGVIIIGRLFVLQVFYSDKYKNLAEENRTRMRVQFSDRGYISDRWGEPIVKNSKSFSALILPESISDIKKVITSIAPLLELTPKDQEKILKTLRRQSRFIPIMLKSNLTWDQVASIELYSAEFPGLYTEETKARDYILKEHASHLIGYISNPSKEEAKNNKILMMPGAKIGKNGIEQRYEDIIKGIHGQKYVEVNARGRVLRELHTVKPVEGKEFKLTVDKELQEYVGQLLAPYKSAAAAVMNVHTGEILALVSIPGYNPNLFFNGIDHVNWKTLITSPQAPMTNKVISGQYSPGSAFKIVMALAALGAGINPEERIACPGYMMLGKHRFHCWQKHGHGSVNLQEALYKSCDVYFYQIARRLPPQVIIDMAHKLGVERKTGIDLAYEQVGFIADPAWKRRVRKEPWYVGDTVLTAIGQGYVLMTPIQLMSMIATVSNGGCRVRPHVRWGEAPERAQVALNPDHLRFVLDSLAKTSNDPGGTAYGSRIRNPDHLMGGKTSTAQVRRITMKERGEGVRQSADLPWHLRDTSQFVGFAPIQNPQYAVVVIGEHEGWGSGFAAYKARDILTKTQEIMDRRHLKPEPVTPITPEPSAR